MIEFFDNDLTKGSASIYESHITLSKNLIKFFSDAYKVRVGVEKEGKKIYIFSIDKDYALSGEIKETSLLSLSVSKSYARVCSRALIEYISNVFNLSIPEKSFLRFDATYDGDKNAVVIFIKGENKE